MSESKTVPKWLQTFLQAEDLSQIEKAVVSAERLTSGEIVPMIVRRSSTTGHVPTILTLLVLTLYWVTDFYYYKLNIFGDQYWWQVGLIDLVGFWLIIRFLAGKPWVQRLLTSRKDQIHQVEMRAINEFYNHRVHHTDRATGVLVFVSLMEKRALILGDDPISAKVSQQDWDEAISCLLRGVKNKNVAQGFNEAIRHVGQLLNAHFPRPKDDKNEIANHLVIKD